MANSTQDTIYDQFRALLDDAESSLAETSDMEPAMAPAQESGSTATPSNIGATNPEGMLGAIADGMSVATGWSGGDSGDTAASTLSTIFTSGLGMVPVIGGLLSLFGRGSSEPPPLVRYTMPDRQYFQGADIGDSIYSADYNQVGAPRVYGSPDGGSSASGSSSGTSQIMVNVQAMDSKSFLDHSSDIAQAVRQAMLQLDPINDVVSDL